MIFSWCWRVWQRGRRRCMYCESDSDSSSNTPEWSDYPCQFCHNDFINQDEVIEHMEICSGTDTEPKVWKLMCTFCQQTFWNIWQDWESYWNSHHVIRNLHNLSQQHHQPGKINWSHEHLSMNRPWTSNAWANPSLLPANLWNKWQRLEAHFYSLAMEFYSTKYVITFERYTTVTKSEINHSLG